MVLVVALPLVMLSVFFPCSSPTCSFASAFSYLQTKRARLEFQLNEAKRLARKALEPKGYPLHAPPKPLPVLKKRKGLKNNKLMQRLSVDRVVAPKLTKPPKPL